MRCLICDETSIGPEVHRLTIGGVNYDRWLTDDQGEPVLALSFHAEDYEDDDKVKWLCMKCSMEYGVFVNLLDDDYCRICGDGFEPMSEVNASCVILMERILLHPNSKTGVLGEIVQRQGFCCFHCLCNAWHIPLWNLDTSDVPPDDYDPLVESWQ